MKIRLIEKSDISSCKDIYNYYVENTEISFEEKPLSYFDFENRVITVSERYPFYVAVNEDNLVVGFAYLSSYSLRSAYRFTADLSIYVHKDFLHLKIGSFLLSTIEQSARNMNIHSIVSVVSSSNTDSIVFHKKNGFTEMGELSEVGFKFNKWQNVKFLQKILEY